MIDDDLQYCPKCLDEYRQEVAICATCSLPLISGAELTAREEGKAGSSRPKRGALTLEDHLVVVFQASLAEVKHLQELLESEQIGTLIRKDSETCGSGGGCAPKFQLQVREEEVQDALQILAAEHRRATVLAEHETTHIEAVFNPEAEEAVCPACGFIFATTATTCPDCGLCFGN